MFDLLRKAGTLISKIIVLEKIYLRNQKEISVPEKKVKVPKSVVRGAVVHGAVLRGAVVRGAVVCGAIATDNILA